MKLLKISINKLMKWNGLFMYHFMAKSKVTKQSVKHRPIFITMYLTSMYIRWKKKSGILERRVGVTFM